MQNIIKYLFLTAIIIACVIMGWYFRSIFFFIAISAVLSLITRPIFDLFKRIHLGKFSVSNGIAALITVFIIWSVIIVFFRYTIPLVGGELQYLSSVDINLTFDRVSVLFSEALEPFRQKNDALALSIESQIREAAIALFDITKIKSSFSGMLNFVGGFVIAAFSITFVTFFFLKEEDLLITLLLVIIPDEYEEGLKHVIQSVKNLLRRYFIGVLIQINLICFLVTSGFLILGVNFNHAITIGLISGLLNIIPYVGPLIGAFFGLLTGVILFLQIQTGYPIITFLLWICLIYAIVQTIDNLVFQPIIFSNSVNAHPLEIFLVILMSGYLAGIVGMFLAIPVYTIFRVVAREFFYKYRVVKKLTERL